MAGRVGAATQAEIAEVKDFTLTMLLCHIEHEGQRDRLRFCAQRLATRFHQPYTKNLALEAFFAERPTDVVNRCIDLLNRDEENRNALKEIMLIK